MKPIEELRELIIDNYIETIHQDLNNGDKVLLYALLSGQGLKPVSDLTEEQVVKECKELGIKVAEIY